MITNILIAQALVVAVFAPGLVLLEQHTATPLDWAAWIAPLCFAALPYFAVMFCTRTVAAEHKETADAYGDSLLSHASNI